MAKKKEKAERPQKIENEEQAAKHAKTYYDAVKNKTEKVVIKGKDVEIPLHDVMYVTDDYNVFYKKNEGEARSHARKIDSKVYEVRFE
jgi:hypothetical protein